MPNLFTVIGMAGEDANFEEVFGFRAPTPEEAQGAADDMSFKFNNEGRPTATVAFFGIPDLRAVAREYMTVMALQNAEKHGISREIAWEIIHDGFVGALELMAAVRLRVDE